MKKIVSLLILFIAVVAVNAQTAKGVIQGVLLDAKSKEPVEFASVALIPQGTTAPVAGCNTEENGSFIITGIKAGNYILQFSFVGYLTDTQKVTVTTNGNKVNVGKIFLKQDKKLLKEVVVSEQRSQMSFEIDKRVFTIDQSIASTGGSATDVLTDIPSVEVSNEGSVSLRGSESVTVWINGKASGLTSDNQGDILQQMPAESIEKIEVITNPSAKHSPEGTAGIINIVLKRNRKAGHYGSIQAGADSKGGYNASGNINYSSGKLDAYASVNYRSNKRENGGKTYTQYFDRDSYQLQTNDGKREHDNLFARAGLTWHPTTKDDIYVNLSTMLGGGDNKNTIIANSGNMISSDITSRRTRITNGENTPQMYNFEGGYTHKFNDNHFVDISVNHNIWNMKNETAYDQTVENENGTLLNSYQFQRNKMKNYSTEVKLDYENKLSENARVEAGYSGRFSNDESPVFTYTDKEHNTIDEKLFNRFIYKQDTHAIYGTYSGRINKFGYQVGLRAEYWKTKTRSLDWSQESNGITPAYTEKDFFSLFPSLFLSYSMNGGHEIQINYTRRLRRPWGGQLNSFSNITDSTNISFGNPDLTPEYSNAYELNYIKNWDKHTLSVSGYYRTTEDVIERVSYNVGNVIYTTNENVASSNSAGLEIIGKNRLWKKFDLTTTVNFFYYKLDGFSYTINEQTVVGKEDENFSWNARMTGSYMLPWGITMQATGRYDARRIVAQGHRKANYSLDLGLRKAFDEHWSLSVSARDILDSRRWHTVTSSGSFLRDAENWHGGRTVNATLTYSFGNMKAKKPMKKPSENMNNYNGYGEEME